MLPWDYNSAFGAFLTEFRDGSHSDTRKVVNKGIDSPLWGTVKNNRPMWEWIEESDEYREKYHEAIDILIREYFASGKFEKEMADEYELIMPYVLEDPAAFYTPEEFIDAYQNLVKFTLYRAESVRRQLDGMLPTYDDLQNMDNQVESEIGVSDLS